MPIKYLVAIPVFNEAGYVADVLERTRPHADHLLVIDDGSTDKTPALLNGFADIHMIRHPRNFGYGQSLIDAFGYAAAQRYDWLITMDCDDQHEPASIPAFVSAMRNADADIISGSRYLRSHSGDDAPPADRRSINLKITRLLNERLGLALTDAFCGFKAYRVSALAKMSLSEPGYAFPMQFWAQAVRRGLSIAEIPVRLVYNDPNRHFGGDLDNPTVRYRHYLDVFETAMRELDDEGAPGVGGNDSATDGCIWSSCCSS
ncbi:MAG: glycosyltransferase family 2 protein [Phycisphaerales bacterium]|nr:glycosyltransferase family 2 protein [Phycisphaerales bacterium]